MHGKCIDMVTILCMTIETSGSVMGFCKKVWPLVKIKNNDDKNRKIIKNRSGSSIKPVCVSCLFLLVLFSFIRGSHIPASKIMSLQ